MSSSLLLSLLIHGLLLSLTFGGQGLGLPGLGFPWQERRVEVPELRVVLVPAPVTARGDRRSTRSRRPAQQASIEPPVAGGRAPTPPASPDATPGACPRDRPSGQAKGRAKPERNAVAPAAPAKASTRPSESRHAVPAKIPKTAAIDVAPSDRPKLVVPTAPTGPDVITAAPSASSPETVMPAHRDPGDLARERIARTFESEPLHWPNRRISWRQRVLKPRSARPTLGRKRHVSRRREWRLNARRPRNWLQHDWRRSGRRPLARKQRRASKPRDGLRHSWRRSVCWQLVKKPLVSRRREQRNWRRSGRRPFARKQRRASKPRDGLRHSWRRSVNLQFVRKPLLSRQRGQHNRRHSGKSPLVRKHSRARSCKTGGRTPRARTTGRGAARGRARRGRKRGGRKTGRAASGYRTSAR